MKENNRTMTGSKTLEPVQRVTVTILVDNFIDNTLKSTPGVSRHRDRDINDPLLAEHGLALLLEVTHRGRKSLFLLDTGSSPLAISHNAEKMGINLRELSGIFLSHNHDDHTSGLEKVLAITGPIPVYIHPHGFYTKWVKSRPTRLGKDRLAGLGARWKAQEGSQSITPFLLTSGSIPRTTAFEEIIGIADRKVEKDGALETETFLDDGALIMNIEKKGLLIVTGCAHSGIINTVNYCQELGGGGSIHALIGGFHVTQASPQRISETIRALQEKKIRRLAPLHCTGFEAMAAIWQAFPQEFIIPSVGTRIEL